MKKLFISILLAIAALASAGCSQIDTGNVGVESVMGQVKSNTIPPGVYFTAFKTVREICAKQVPIHLNGLNPQTSDKITLHELDVDIYIQINPVVTPLIMTKWAGDMSEEKGEGCDRVGMNFVQRQAREVIFDVTSKFPSATIHTQRGALAVDVVKELQNNLDANAGKDLFYVRSANVRDLKTDPALDAAIKAAAQQQFRQQEENGKKITAVISADVARITAQGEADAMRIKAAAIAAQGGREYVDLKAIEKWDGKLPTNNGGAMPFINVK